MRTHTKNDYAGRGDNAWRLLQWLVAAMVIGLVLSACGSGEAELVADPAGTQEALATDAGSPTPTQPERPQTTQPPITEPPVTTAPPITEPPVTTAPPTTAPPTTEPPTTEPPDEPVDELRAALDAAVEATAAEATASISGSTDSIAEGVTFEGVVGLDGRVFAGQIVFGSDPPVDVIVVGDTAYVALPDLPFGATWREIIHDDEFPPPSTTLDMPFGFLSVLAALDADEPLVLLEEADDGARHLGLPIDADLLLDVAGVEAGWFGAWSTRQLRPYAEVWIDADGRVTNVTLTVEMGPSGDSAFSLAVEVDDFGVEAELSAPPPEDVATDDDYGIPFAALEVGDCYLEPAVSDSGIVYGVQLVACEELHLAEVFAVLSHPAPSGPYPGDEEMNEDAGEMCLAEFEDYVGEPYETSPYYFTYVYPLADNWDRGDRLIVCSIVAPDFGPLEGSVRDRQL